MKKLYGVVTYGRNGQRSVNAQSVTHSVKAIRRQFGANVRIMPVVASDTGYAVPKGTKAV